MSLNFLQFIPTSFELGVLGETIASYMFSWVQENSTSDAISQQSQSSSMIKRYNFCGSGVTRIGVG